MTLAETQVAEVRAEQASNDYCLRGPLSTVGDPRAGFLPSWREIGRSGIDLPAAGARSPARNLSGAGFLLPPQGAIQRKSPRLQPWVAEPLRASPGRAKQHAPQPHRFAGSRRFLDQGVGASPRFETEAVEIVAASEGRFDAAAFRAFSNPRMSLKKEDRKGGAAGVLLSVAVRQRGWGCGARGLAFEAPLPCFHRCRNPTELTTKSTVG